MKATDYPEKTVEVWPDNESSVRVFMALATQWRTGAAGATGFDYNVLPELWRRLKVPLADRDDVFDDLRLMEMAALDAMHAE